MPSALSSLAVFWREQAKVLEGQGKEWHEVALFCRKIREELKEVLLRIGVA